MSDLPLGLSGQVDTVPLVGPDLAKPILENALGFAALQRSAVTRYNVLSSFIQT